MIHVQQAGEYHTPSDSSCFAARCLMLVRGSAHACAEPAPVFTCTTRHSLAWRLLEPLLHGGSQAGGCAARFRALPCCESRCQSQVQRAHVGAVVKLALAAGAEALPGLAHGLDAVRAEGVPALDDPVLLPAAVAHLPNAWQLSSPQWPEEMYQAFLGLLQSSSLFRMADGTW